MDPTLATLWNGHILQFGGRQTEEGIVDIDTHEL